MSEPTPRVLWAVLPVKSFARGKSRLGGVLADPLRSAFARGLFEHVLSALKATPEIAGVVVLTDDDEVASLARARGCETLSDAPCATLSQIVDAGLARAQRLGATAALVCMADLPHVLPADFQRVAAALETCQVVLAPDAAEAGTNLLALAPPTLFPSCFGRADSFAQHVASARRASLEPRVLRVHGLCFDVDGPQDLAELEPNSE
jgi:2-phospho-L-lactate guanylyltransferase